jgi:hypothetical protein
MSRLIPRLSYANVVATLALFIALGGATYAAVELPANSVGVRQIAFPIGGQTATGAGGRLTVTGCSGNIPCPAPIPTSLARVTVHLRAPTKLLILGSAQFEVAAPSSTSPTVQVDFGDEFNNTISLPEHPIVGASSQTLNLTDVVAATAGTHTIRLMADASPTPDPLDLSRYSTR